MRNYWLSVFNPKQLWWWWWWWCYICVKFVVEKGSILCPFWNQNWRTGQKDVGPLLLTLWRENKTMDKMFKKKLLVLEFKWYEGNKKKKITIAIFVPGSFKETTKRTRRKLLILIFHQQQDHSPQGYNLCHMLILII